MKREGGRHARSQGTLVRPVCLTSLLVIFVTAVLLEPSSTLAVPNSTLYGLVSTGEVWASVDGGGTWDVRGRLPVSDAVGLMAGKIDTDLTVISRTGFVYKATDAGYHWSASGVVPASNLVDVTVRFDGSLVVLSQVGTVYFSNDGGQNWSILATLTSSDFVSLTAIQDDHLHALTCHGQVFTSTDAGASWSVTAALTMSDAVSIRGFSDQLHVLTYTGEILQSNDGGYSFTTVTTLAQTGMCGLTLTHEGLAASTIYGEVATSSDGIYWNWVGTINQVWVTALASDVTIVSSTPPGHGRFTFGLGNPYPNPGNSNGTTFFPVILAGETSVHLELYDVRGWRIGQQSKQHFISAGQHELAWNPGPLAAGTYFVRLVSDSGQIATAKWLVVR
jgi:hypothetical protein